MGKKIQCCNNKWTTSLLSYKHDIGWHDTLDALLFHCNHLGFHVFSAPNFYGIYTHLKGCQCAVIVLLCVSPIFLMGRLSNHYSVIKLALGKTWLASHMNILCLMNAAFSEDLHVWLTDLENNHSYETIQWRSLKHSTWVSSFLAVSTCIHISWRSHTGRPAHACRNGFFWKT